MSRGSRSCVIQVTPRTHETRMPLAFSMRCTDRAASAIGSRVRGASMIASFACAVRIEKSTNLTSRFGCYVRYIDALCAAQTIISHFMHEQV